MLTTGVLCHCKRKFGKERAILTIMSYTRVRLKKQKYKKYANISRGVRNTSNMIYICLVSCNEKAQLLNTIGIIFIQI